MNQNNNFGPVLETAVREKATQFALPERLLRAMVAHESQGNPLAQRYEPGYRWLWDCAKNTPFRKLSNVDITLAKAPPGFSSPIAILSADTEWTGQRTSYGPLQVMGAVAREYGFKGWFGELLGTLGLYYGCLHLDKLRDRHQARHGWPGVCRAYNTGSPEPSAAGDRYIRKIMAAGCDPRTL
jgi:hypothetical protein